MFLSLSFTAADSSSASMAPSIMSIWQQPLQPLEALWLHFLIPSGHWGTVPATVFVALVLVCGNAAGYSRSFRSFFSHGVFAFAWDGAVASTAQGGPHTACQGVRSRELCLFSEGILFQMTYKVCKLSAICQKSLSILKVSAYYLICPSRKPQTQTHHWYSAPVYLAFKKKFLCPFMLSASPFPVRFSFPTEWFDLCFKIIFHLLPIWLYFFLTRFHSFRFCVGSFLARISFLLTRYNFCQYGC